jgi:hypothetical protein
MTGGWLQIDRNTNSKSRERIRVTSAAHAIKSDDMASRSAATVLIGG